jgi:hypothetical protein
MPGRNTGNWSESNTGYRFTPSGATSNFVSLGSGLYDMTGTLIMPADTLTTTPGLLDISFPNFCPPAGSNQYVVKPFLLPAIIRQSTHKFRYHYG